MYKVIVFDIDGTLFDTKPGIICAIDFVLKAYKSGNVCMEKQDRYIGPPIKESLIKYHGFADDEAEKAVQLYRKIYIDKYITKSEPYEGLAEVLLALKSREYILGIATMKTQRQVEKLLQIFDIGNYFTIIKNAREDGTLSKKQMLIEIRHEYLSSSEKFIMVGDTQGDYEAAKKANFQFIGVDYGYGKINDSTVPHISQLKDILDIII